MEISKNIEPFNIWSLLQCSSSISNSRTEDLKVQGAWQSPYILRTKGQLSGFPDLT